MLMLYLLIRAQVGSVEKNLKGASQKYIVLTKWVVFGCFFIRELFIFVERVVVNRLGKDDPFFKIIEANIVYKALYTLLNSSLKGRFFNRFCVLFCCQYYTFFKTLKNRIKHIEKESSLRSLPRKDVFN